MSQDVPHEVQTMSPGNGSAPAKPEEIERQIELARSHLAETIDALSVRMSPKQVARRNLDRARAVFTAQDGGLDRAKVAGAVAGVTLVIALLVWRRRSR